VKKGRKDNASKELRVELKYCERCGTLWLRACGGGQVYCQNCLPAVDELPAPRLTRTSPQLPVATRSFIDEGEIDFSDMDELDLQSSGGVA
jgi:hypothetical protein